MSFRKRKHMATTTPSTSTNVAEWRSQFAHPRGWLGSLVGHVMAIKSLERSLWVLSQLNLQPDDRVLEIGFGPGVDIQRVSARVRYVAGIDHSAVMVRQAEQRNRAVIDAGKVELHQASMAEQLFFPDGNFTKIFSINSYQFWPDPEASLCELRRLLRLGGLIAIAVQPRGKGVTDEETRHVEGQVREQILAAGFSGVQTAAKPMKPAAVICVKDRSDHQLPADLCAAEGDDEVGSIAEEETNQQPPHHDIL
jgi:SAM-dependent methyltransferase